MATWSDIQAFARSRYEVDEEEGSLALTATFTSGRTQKLTIRPYEALGARLIEFRAAVCRLKDLPPEEALRRNLSLPLGALALVDDIYVLVHRLPIENLDANEFELPLNALIRFADEMESTYSQGADEF